MLDTAIFGGHRTKAFRPFIVISAQTSTVHNDTATTGIIMILTNRFAICLGRFCMKGRKCPVSLIS